MKKIISLVMIMLMLTVSVAFAQEVTNETQDTSVVDAVVDSSAIEATTEIQAREVPAVETVSEDAPVPTLYVATNETEATPALISAPIEATTEIVGGSDYSWLSEMTDKVQLIFTFKEENRVQLMEKIAAKRESHYQFLIAKGKTKQAEKWNEGSARLSENLKKSIEKVHEKEAKAIEKLNEKAAKINETNREKVQERIENRIENKSEKVEEAVQERTQERLNEVDENIQERQDKINSQAGKGNKADDSNDVESEVEDSAETKGNETTA